MTATPALSRAVIIERDFPHPPEKIWRALTQVELLADWLMNNDFRPIPGHRFKFTADWGAVECQVLTVEPHHTLAYSWGAYGLETIVTWTLSPTPTGTLLRMEQTGFGPDQTQAYLGARAGWARFITALEQTLSRQQ